MRACGRHRVCHRRSHLRGSARSMVEPRPAPKRILIVEDNELNMKLLRVLLEAHGYASDPAQRRALDNCALEIPAFDRLDSAARELCYQHSANGRPAPENRPIASVNFVDQWQAAGQGRLQRDDIRAGMRDQRYLR